VKSEEYGERQIEVAGWPVRLASYRIGKSWYCRADNVSPGASLARSTAASRDEAEQKALARATELLSRIRRYPV